MPTCSWTSGHTDAWVCTCGFAAFTAAEAAAHLPVTSEADKIIANHVSDGKRLCYAESLGPITAVHQFSNSTDARVLRCTLPLDHNKGASRSPHRDGACCYTPHTFGAEMATAPKPEHRNLERCNECRQAWPCDVAKIAATLA